MKRPFRLSGLLLALLLALVWLPGCRSEPVPTFPAETDTTEPTPTPRPDPEETDPQPTPVVTEPEPVVTLEDLAEYGHLESGFSLVLPGGSWFDLSGQEQVRNVENLLVEAAEPGKPTLSRPQEDQSLLEISNSNQVIFRNIRFGYPQAGIENGTAAGELPLVSIRESSQIHFENCEFFGGTGPAILLEASENITFSNCQFYNLGGLPIVSVQQALPSQVLFSGCSFETRDSGLMPLHLRDSVFEQCIFIGTDGYRLPVLAMACEKAARHSADLSRQMQGILAGQVHYHRDAYQAITIRQGLFASRDVYVLYQQLEEELARHLPQAFSQFSLAGEKAGEQPPGRSLDPTLGLRVDVRVQTAENNHYDFRMLKNDLQPLRELPDTFSTVLDGDLHVRLFDPFNRRLLQGSLPLSRISEALDPERQTAWLQYGQWDLLQPLLVAEDFAGRSLGRLTAHDSRRILEEAWLPASGHLFFNPASDPENPVYLKAELVFRGTRLNPLAAWHQFELTIERSARSDQSDCFYLHPALALQVQAGNGQKKDLNMPEAGGRTFWLPQADQQEWLTALLETPLQLVVTSEQASQIQAFGLQAGDNLTLHLPAGNHPAAWPLSPILLYEQEEERVVLKIILYDEEFRPWTVILTVTAEDGQPWQVSEAELAAS